MFHSLFLDMIRGAARAVIHELHGEPSAPAEEAAVAFMAAEQAQMRIPFGWGVAAIAVLLDIATRLRRGRRFSALTDAERTARLDAWARHPLTLIRTFVQWARALTALAYFDTDEGLQRHGYDVGRVRAMTALYNSTGYEQS